MLRLSRRLFTATAAAIVAISPVYSAAARETSADLGDVSSLDPGEFVWNSGVSSQGEIEIVVSLPEQRAYVFRGGSLIGVSTVSSGRPGYDTPTGRFNILQKRRVHHSNLYDGAPMPFMQRLTWDGIALHAGEIPGEPASHGCIRLPHGFASKLFEATELGATVHVTDLAPDSPATALALVRGNSDFTGMGGPEEDSGAPD